LSQQRTARCSRKIIPGILLDGGWAIGYSLLIARQTQAGDNAMKRLFKVYLVNAKSIGTMCGFGCGRTLEDAIADAINMAKQYYGENCNPQYSNGSVWFDGGMPQL
jgi:hypothetical protein